jgi:hypothetical protein
MKRVLPYIGWAIALSAFAASVRLDWVHPTMTTVMVWQTYWVEKVVYLILQVGGATFAILYKEKL